MRGGSDHNFEVAAPGVSMGKQRRFLDPPGTAVRPSALRTAKGKAFAEFIRASDGGAFASLLSFGRVADPGGDVLVLQIQVERPQKLVHPIFREERIAVIFFDEDSNFPDVLALRADFPRVPHTNLRAKELPRSLCLYDQNYQTVKLDWTPARFLFRLRYWLQKTATGSLHGGDQPLEPLIQGAPQRLILRGDCSLSEMQKQSGLFQVFRCPGTEDEITLVAKRINTASVAKADSVAAVFVCEEQTHGIISYQPANLEQLHDFCSKAGLNLGEQLAAKVKAWLLEKPTKEILQCRLVVILLLPKRRQDGTRVETVEQWAFMSMASVQEVGIALDVMATSGGAAGYIISGPTFKKEKLAAIPVATLQVLHGLSPPLAADMNGVVEDKRSIVAIGMGALGSQLFNNLIRSGFGRWTLVDLDTLLPHNCARHFLGEWAVGQNKAEAMAQIANAVLDQPADAAPIAAAIPEDFLNPRKYATDLDRAYNSANLVLDLSASIAVSRRCASSKTKARHIGAFLTPPGTSLILTAEDTERHVRLDWLEMLHYRAVLNEPALRDSLRPPDARFRYGNSCRDVSLQLAQDDTALWAATASKAIKQLAAESEARVRIYHAGKEGLVSRVDAPVTRLLSVKHADWVVRFDKYLLDRMAGLRKEKLPNETGGILLGHFDTSSRICSIIDVVESPPDSEEWPTSYIRGCAGLQERVHEAEEQTLNQIGYVGEWHSHPRGAAVTPSRDDLKAYGWLAARMLAETLPAIMVIIGDARRFCLVSAS
ncbi:MAG: ThiF family adenylyltransferase [Verrucomicrobiales bacterium]|nr:ThiF family adenylyltransferase [Verrucomicrobiales bacterium]